MNPERLLKHYEKIADAPDAIARLRRFILDLAVRGKLVPQDPNDEPAPDSLKHMRIAFTATGPFEIPRAWSWVRVGAISEARLGKMLDKSKNRGTPRPYLRNINVRWFDFDLSDVLLMPFEDFELEEFSLRRGDVLICEGGEPGRAAVWDERTQGIFFQKAIHRVRFASLVDPHFFVKALKASADDGRLAESFTGTGIKHFTGRGLDGFWFPLPPLAEQRRIVAKVDELMGLCDRLEAAREAREATRDRLAAASLVRLNAPDPETFEADARFALDALPALTTRPDQIKALRQTILNLAVRGKLVPQDPNDEPASELLKRIAKEKARLVKVREIRSREIQPPIALDEEPFVLPRSWVWTRLGTLCFLITDGAHHTPNYQDEGVPFLSVKDVSSGTIELANTRFISPEAHRELAKRCNPEFGDILLTKVGTTGIAVVVDTEQEFSIFVSLALLKFSSENIDRRFLCHLINSPFVKQQSADNTQGIGNKNLVLRLINQFAIPLPPLAEQRRIVAKVDALMALCDRLEASLDLTAATRRRLLDAILAEALAPVVAREMAAE